ncbi:MAG: hypothetical protein RLY20_2242 [Verrucomicrobiota bacterium]|jgi:maltose O-acetyltransferase
MDSLLLHICAMLRRNRLRLFRWREANRHHELTIGFGCEAAVPLRGGGNGTPHIGRNNLFGFPHAFRIGNGEIFLHARAQDASVTIGDRNHLSNCIAIIASHFVSIGNDCQIGHMVAIYGSDFHELNPATRTLSSGASASVVIGNNVWLGSRVMVLKGVTIGDNSVVGAMSVVTKSIPADCVAAGNPARVIRRLDPAPSSAK